MKPYKLVYTCQSEDDLSSIFDYIAENSVDDALDYIDRMQLSIENLPTSPYIGVSCRAKGIDRDCRILIFENFMIFYQVNEDDSKIMILRILHGSREYQDLLN